jgi:hypothetical protein
MPFCVNVGRETTQILQQNPTTLTLIPFGLSLAIVERQNTSQSRPIENPELV